MPATLNVARARWFLGQSQYTQAGTVKPLGLEPHKRLEGRGETPFVVLEFAGAEVEARFRKNSINLTMPLREEEWGEKLFQVTDPNGIIIQCVEWVTH